ncbi:hypothetical protein T484DRAFT_1798682 [Baffinella frigidus]|nr:hypothetical protein T484DRAFT_1798682 [Cryptophyta sp. CCMP2293]
MSPFLPPVVAAWEHAAKLAAGGEVETEAFLVAVEKLAPIADSLGRVYAFLRTDMSEHVDQVRKALKNAPADRLRDMVRREVVEKRRKDAGSASNALR